MANSSPNEDPLLADRISSFRRKKRLFIAVMILWFTICIAAIIAVLTVLKHHFDAESPAKNPDLAIQSACSLSGAYSWPHCNKILSPLRDSSDTNSTQIFSLSIGTAIDAIQDILGKLTHLHESNLSSCGPLFNETLSRLGVAWTDFGGAAVRNLTDWLSVSGYMVEECLYRTDNWEMRDSVMYAGSSIKILRNADAISEAFSPAIKSALASFFGSWENNAVTVSVIGLQYLFLVLLFCIVLRVN